MIVVRHHPRSFLQRAGRWLERAEAENHMLLGLARGLEAGTTTRSATPLLATVEQDGLVVAAALRTPPHNLIVTRADEAALVALVAGLRRDGVALPGVMGPAEVAARFAELWSPGRSTLAMGQLIYQCAAVQPVREAPGALRRAEEGDRTLLEEWIGRFFEDVGETLDPQRLRAMAAQHLSARTAFVWDDGEVRCLTLVAGKTAHGIRVSGVYTAPMQRGRGYGTSCVAEVTRQMLAAGRSFCFLYTDRSNATSNRIYRRIGYETVCESAVWRFPER